MDDNKAQNPDRDAERWLDAALSARMGAQAEPRPGLAERVLARLATEPKRKPALTWRLAFAAVAAVVLISAALLLMRTSAPEKPTSARTSRPQANPEQIAKVRPQGVPHQPQRVQRRLSIVAAKRSTASTQKEATPKLATFPAATPETETERALAALADSKQNSDQLKTLGNFASLKDLQVSPIDVPALRFEDEAIAPRNSQN